jgi:alpha-glucuronidase
MKAFSGIIIFLFLIFGHFPLLIAEDGYRLWLRYDLINDIKLLDEYNKTISSWIVQGETPVCNSIRSELELGLNGMLGKNIPGKKDLIKNGTIIAGTPENSTYIEKLNLNQRFEKLSPDGYLIFNTILDKKAVIIIASKTESGILYGTFHFLRLLQTHQSISLLNISSSPKTKIRILNHWDNLNGSVERGYAGNSLWDWNSLPESISDRYTDYARANASVGINGTVLTNVNADARILTTEYLEKVSAIAGIMRYWGIRVYLTARLSAPVEIGGLKTADPLDPKVIAWWKKKAVEIYSYIPDFGGFLVKANSEGQPGPQNYKRTHADGANMLADALAPFGGVVMWRAFVYDKDVPDDRAKQAYNEFVPLDGKFRSNVIIQVKNGPIDFQPREPFHPLFGALPNTSVMPEFQITQEYLGFSRHLVYLAPLYEECLKSDTYAKGKGSLVAEIIDGSLEEQTFTAMAGVANTGNDRNWTGHPFGQANWYAFGRLAWDPLLGSAEIAVEWIRMTFSNNIECEGSIGKIMLSSREIAVDYMTPIGLHHIMYAGLHYGPGPWVDNLRPDWTSVYYHRADSAGIGFDRTSTGSNAVGQYFPEVRDVYESPETCPENLLLWFHHVSWDYRMKSGRTVWEELCFKYNSGVDSVRWMQREWDKNKAHIDSERFLMVQVLLSEQEENAVVWRDACLLYFQTFSNKPIPEIYEKPAHSLEYYRNLRYNF